MEYLFSFENNGYKFGAYRESNDVIVQSVSLSPPFKGIVMDVYINKEFVRIFYKEDFFKNIDALKENVIDTVNHLLTLPTCGS